MFTSFILGLSNLFGFTFKILPYIGFIAGWTFTLLCASWFIYWCIKIKEWGNE